MKLLVGSTPSSTTNVHKATSTFWTLAQERAADLSVLDYPRVSSRLIWQTTGAKRSSRCARVHALSWNACHAANTFLTIRSPSCPSRTRVPPRSTSF